MKPIAELTEVSLDETRAAASDAVVVDLYASWCGPGKLPGPLLGQLAAAVEVQS